MKRLTFALRGVPENWDNSPIFGGWNRSRKAYFAGQRRYAEWRSDTIDAGQIARAKAGWPEAAPEDSQRTVFIHQKRHGELDEDGLASSCKAIVDGLKAWLWRKVQGNDPESQRMILENGGKVKYAGASLIWDDRPRYVVVVRTQEVVARIVEPVTQITVEIKDA